MVSLSSSLDVPRGKARSRIQRPAFFFGGVNGSVVAFPGLVVAALVAGGVDDRKGNGNQGTGEVEKNQVVGVEGHGCRLRKRRLSVQNRTARATPKSANAGRKMSRIYGMATDARKTWAMSAEMSESLLICDVVKSIR